MLIVAGLSLKNLQPRVWDPASPWYLAKLRAVMVSYAEFDANPSRRRAAMALGLHTWLGTPTRVRIFLDNGAFAFLRRGGGVPLAAYEDFVARARPDWWPIPQDFIPAPSMSVEEQSACLLQTAAMNLDYRTGGYAPVVHACPLLDEYLAHICSSPDLMNASSIAIGGLVPNLLRSPRAMPYADILDGLARVRRRFAGKPLHLFGVGGTATLHLAGLLAMDSLDSSGWRNRAARGIVQLPGRGDRMVANMGSWRGREPSAEEWELLAGCLCPACRWQGVDGLRASGIGGFCCRATHNLAVLLNEADEIERRITDGSYPAWFGQHIENSIYLPLIRYALGLRATLLEETPL